VGKDVDEIVVGKEVETREGGPLLLERAVEVPQDGRQLALPLHTRCITMEQTESHPLVLAGNPWSKRRAGG